MKPLNPVINGIKACTSCGMYLPVDKFRVRKQHGREYIVARCRKCETEHTFIQYDREKRRQRERKKYSHPLKRNKKNRFQREWRAKNIEKNRAYHRKHIKKQVDAMSDSYIGRMIFHTKTGVPVPQDLIKLKRLQLIAKRILKLKVT